MLAEMDRLGRENAPEFEDWGILPSEWPQEDWSDIAPKDDQKGSAAKPRKVKRSGPRKRT
jgi:hypothetical protein